MEDQGNQRGSLIGAMIVAQRVKSACEGVDQGRGRLLSSKVSRIKHCESCNFAAEHLRGFKVLARDDTINGHVRYLGFLIRYLHKLFCKS